MIEKNFTWVETHKQITKFLSTKENNQKELIELLKEVGIGPFNDKSNEGEHDILLEEIDPFTFFCYIYKYGSEKRLKYLQEIAKKLNISIPSGESGIPSSQAQKVWLFPYKYARNNNEIPRLWNFFKKAIVDKISDIDFEDILMINSIGKTKITEALFYINPEKYLPINGPTKPYIKEVLKINPSFSSYSEYVLLLEQIKTKINIPFFELSFTAWEWNLHKNKNMNNFLKYSSQLTNFLEQAKTDNLKTRHFMNKYLGTTVKVSFGQGNVARVPWISFLTEPHTTSNGIYPVYLFYKDVNKLILAYGISETNIPRLTWDIQSTKTIAEYFKENNLGKPDRYGTSYVYKVYDVNDLPNATILDDDLNVFIETYLNIKAQNRVEVPELIALNIFEFPDCLKKCGLMFNQQLVARFAASLLTKPFVILSGLSGSGKTKLAQAFVKWICKDETQYRIIPVGADWTNREPLLGYPNGLEEKSYVNPDSGALQLIINALDRKHIPHFLILDEMNLSHVERYFADFLSIMESDDTIKLYSGSERNGSKESKIPYEIGWPTNLYIIGTVNIDETTYMFSPKVLDRANVIEFRISPNEMETFFKEKKSLDLNNLHIDGKKENGGLGHVYAADFQRIATDKEVRHNIDISVLNNFFVQLQNVGAEFGYRSAHEMELLLTKLSHTSFHIEGGELFTNNEKLDIAIMQKLLPKLHGSRKKLVGPLETLAGFCLTRKDESQPVEKDKNKSIYQQFIAEKCDATKWDINYKISFEKIERMLKNVIDNGFTSYAEA